MGLTQKQKLFLDQLSAYVRQHGYFPPVRQIGVLTGLRSPATVHAYLQRLLRLGLVAHSPEGGWSLGQRTSGVPLVGIVPAGPPSELFSHLGEEVELPDWMLGSGDLVAFRVSGESMRDAFILDGDVVVIKPTVQAEIGEMVVAMLEEGGITLKRLARLAGQLVLKPENPDYEVITEAFTLVGKVVSVLRRFR
jgi:repressor LexA